MFVLDDNKMNNNNNNNDDNMNVVEINRNIKLNVWNNNINKIKHIVFKNGNYDLNINKKEIIGNNNIELKTWNDFLINNNLKISYGTENDDPILLAISQQIGKTYYINYNLLYEMINVMITFKPFFMGLMEIDETEYDLYIVQLLNKTQKCNGIQLIAASLAFNVFLQVLQFDDVNNNIAVIVDTMKIKQIFENISKRDNEKDNKDNKQDNENIYHVVTMKVGKNKSSMDIIKNKQKIIIKQSDNVITIGFMINDIYYKAIKNELKMDSGDNMDDIDDNETVSDGIWVLNNNMNDKDKSDNNIIDLHCENESKQEILKEEKNTKGNYEPNQFVQHQTIVTQSQDNIGDYEYYNEYDYYDNIYDNSDSSDSFYTNNGLQYNYSNKNNNNNSLYTGSYTQRNQIYNNDNNNIYNKYSSYKYQNNSDNNGNNNYNNKKRKSKFHVVIDNLNTNVLILFDEYNSIIKKMSVSMEGCSPYALSDEYHWKKSDPFIVPVNQQRGNAYIVNLESVEVAKHFYKWILTLINIYKLKVTVKPYDPNYKNAQRQQDLANIYAHSRNAAIHGQWEQYQQ